MANMPDAMKGKSGGDAARLASIIGGGAAMVWGLQRRDVPGLLAAAAGGAMLYYSMKGSGGATKDIDVHTSVSIDRSAKELYDYWHGFTRLPQFMRYVKEVTPVGPNKTHWVARAPVGPEVEWDSEVTADEPNRRIAWRSLEGSELMNEGEVRFLEPETSRDERTVVELAMRFHPPGGTAGMAAGQMMRGLTRKEIEADLRRFKQLMESGESTAGGAVAQ